MEHRLYATILIYITTRNTEYINKVTQITRSEKLGSLYVEMANFDFMFLIFRHSVDVLCFCRNL
jgi:hypothetical protein